MKEKEQRIKKWISNFPEIQKLFEYNRKEIVNLIYKIMDERDNFWNRRLNAIADECTTDLGTTDFEMFAEKVFKLISDKE